MGPLAANEANGSDQRPVCRASLGAKSHLKMAQGKRIAKPKTILGKHFLELPVNSVVREKIFANVLEGEMRLSATRAKVSIRLYPADVDKDGLDFLVIDENRHRAIQTKTADEHARTGKWETFKSFLRPGIRTASKHQLVGFPPTHEGTSLGGGIVLMRITDLSLGTVEYWYTDFFVILAFSERLIMEGKRQGKKSKPYMTLRAGYCVSSNVASQMRGACNPA